MPSVANIAADLAIEQTTLDEIVEPLTADQWYLETPSHGWRIAEQIAHLAYYDHTAAMAIADAAGFAELRDRFLAQATERPDVAETETLAAARNLDPAALLDHWRGARAELASAAATLTDDTRIDWYGPSMSARSFLTARLMEAWAHGQDIADTLGIARRPTDRLRHIAQLGVITRGWTYANRGLPLPDTEVRVELLAPSGSTWTWGPDDAPAMVVGSALDFALVTTQRRSLTDTSLVTSGAAAREWLIMAQAFAGPPTDGPDPRTPDQPRPSGDA